MYVSLVVLLAAAASEQPLVVDLPIQQVMVFSDRARVTRRGPVKLEGGPQAVRISDLPGTVMLDSIRVTTTGTKLVRVEVQSVMRDRWSIDQVDSWIVELENLGDQMRIIAGRRDAAVAELSLLSGLQAAPPLPEKDRLGKSVAPSPDAWRDAQDRLAKRRTSARTIERETEQQLRELTKQYQRVQREVERRDLGGFVDQKQEVMVMVEGGTSGTINVEYAVPGAFWKPSYDLFFDPDKGSVELKAAGVISQATGEDWPNVQLALSTAMPGRGINMPTLRTWTLGDDREYVPQATARTTPIVVTPFAPPPARPRQSELDAAADSELLSMLVQQLRTLAVTTPELEKDEDGVADEVSSKISESRPRPAPRSKKRRADAPREEREYAPEAMAMSAPSAPSPITIAESVLDFADDAVGGSVSRSRQRSMQLIAGQRWQPPDLGDPTLPAMAAGGLDYVYDAPIAVTVPSQADTVRVPLAVRTYAVKTFYEATPSLATTAYLKATVQNGSQLPILAGPASVFVKRTFAGDAQLDTTGLVVSWSCRWVPMKTFASPAPWCQRRRPKGCSLARKTSPTTP
jgi:hypothetical protein